MERVEQASAELPRQFGEWLADQLAQRRDLTTSDLAAELGLFDGDVEDWLAGRSMPSGDEIRRLAVYFAIPDREMILRFVDASGEG
jgi:transcriptional regulator with XRE-family HTH domain